MFLLTSKHIELSEHTYACTQSFAEKKKVYTKKTFSYETQNSGIFCNILRMKLSVIANFF